VHGGVMPSLVAPIKRNRSAEDPAQEPAASRGCRTGLHATYVSTSALDRATQPGPKPLLWCPTRRVVSTPGGEIEATGNRAQGILTTEEDAITEYHNRLAQFVRLRHTTTPDVLSKEFGTGVVRRGGQHRVVLRRGSFTC